MDRFYDAHGPEFFGSEPASTSVPADVAHWKRKLRGTPALIPIPTDWPRSYAHEHPCECAPITISEPTAAHLRRTARDMGPSLQQVFLSSWAAVLGRWSGQSEVLIATTLEVQQAETEPLHQPLERILPLRIKLEGLTVAQLLGQVDIELCEARAHAAVSLSQLAESLLPEDTAPQLSQVRFAFQRVSLKHLARELPRHAPANAPSRAELSLSITESDDTLAGSLRYATDLFERRTIERLISSWIILMEALASDMQQPLQQLPILTATEHLRVVGEFNRTSREYCQAKLIHELFEDQVNRTPAVVAVIEGERSLTYAQLNARANHLARLLRADGVGPDEIVGLLVDRSIEMVIGIMGVLKAGGAYVPLDPAYPTQRVIHMLQDAAPRILVTQQHLRDRLPECVQHIIAIDGDWDAVASYAGENLDTAAIGLTHRNLAYLIYTSGSTGLPKGVLNEHCGMSNRLFAQQAIEQFTASDICCQKTSISFVDAVFEILGPLCNGVPLVIIPTEAVIDTERMAELIARHGVTQLTTVPSLARSMLENPSVMRNLSSLRVWTLSGEKVAPDLLQKLRRQLPSCETIILYGASEVSSDAATFRCGDFVGDHVPIGRPVPNVTVYILDPQGRPVPTGVIGEIHVGGVGIARGYQNRPELTQDRFITDPFSDVPGARLYKTGDLGRWRPDGLLECLGRNDSQVKIRGFRIELGEIEAQLLRLPQVREAVVVPREDDTGHKQVVAYITTRDSMADSTIAHSLRSYLQTTLPDFMIPRAFIVLDEMPHTPNGKLDRRALPEPAKPAQSATKYEPPQGARELILAQIWKELLGLLQVGRHDNFFELGGHSLLIALLINRLRGEGLTIKAREIFQHPALAEMASQLIEPTARDSHESASLLSREWISTLRERLENQDIEDIYPLSPLQHGILFHHLLDEEGGDSYMLPTLLSLASRDQLERFIQGMQDLIDRHDVLRSSFHWEGLPEPVQVVQRRAELGIEELVLNPKRDTVEQLKDQLELRNQILDLRRAPLMRVRIALGGPRSPSYVLLQFHHLICDQQSIESLLGDLRARVDERPLAPLRPLLYSRHVAQTLSQARSGNSETFFKHKLADVEEATAPFGVREGRGGRAQIAQANGYLDVTIARRLRRQGRNLGVSPAILFHAAWALVLASSSGRDDIVFGTVLSGRTQRNAMKEDGLGLFMNTLPLRLKLKALTPRALVEQVQHELGELLEYEHASLSTAQRCSGVGANTPLFTALLNYMRTAQDTDELADDSSSGMRIIASAEWTNYPIVLHVKDFGTGFSLKVQTDRRIGADRMLNYVQRALESLVTGIERSSHDEALDLAVLPDSERYQLLEALNATEGTYQTGKLVHQLFEEQVARTPEACALIHHGECLTYAALDQKANHLAVLLRAYDVGPDELVAICLDRGFDLVIALLATLKAGGAYVPLDPTYPAERLQYMLEDSSPRVVLTQELIVPRLSRTSAKTLTMEAVWSGEGRARIDTAHDVSQPHSQPTARNLAYVIYTSGSTGTPKGVMLEHAGVVNFLSSMQRAPGITAWDCLLAVTTISFDIAALELFLPLISGARIVLADRDDAMDANRLINLIEQFDVTVLQATPATFNLLLNNNWLGRSRLRALCGGEAVSRSLAERLRPKVQDLWNMYGPTETTIWSTCCRIDGTSSGVSTEPIGRPISNTRIVLLDSRRRLVPFGAIGEIHIGGAGLARGYLHQPHFTAERFIPDPFIADSLARLYKTGDLGRWLPDGTLEYLGRNDQQVKIRGFRVELGDIEAQVLRHASVREAAVVAREESPGDVRLVAYLVPREADTIRVDELREHLHGVLPVHMIPNAFVILESLPLTPNGKLNRRALPPPDPGVFSGITPYAPPQGPVESLLAGIWEGLLRVEPIGRHADFFELGGHSLLAMQAVTRARAALRADIPLRLLFEYPILQGLAARLEVLLEEHLLEGVDSERDDLSEIIARVASMSENDARELMKELTRG